MEGKAYPQDELVLVKCYASWGGESGVSPPPGKRRVTEAGIWYLSRSSASRSSDKTEGYPAAVYLPAETLALLEAEDSGVASPRGTVVSSEFPAMGR